MSSKKALAAVEYRTKVLERLKQLLANRDIEERLVDEQAKNLADAQRAEESAMKALIAAHQRLFAAKIRLRVAEDDARAADPHPVSPTRTLPRK